MIPVTELSPPALGAAALWALFLLLLLIYDLLRLALQRRGLCRVLGLGGAILAEYLIFQCLLQCLDALRPPAPPLFRALPAALLLLAQLGVSVWAVMSGIASIRWARMHITPFSVKHSLDTLPVGLCYFWPGGLPKLVNERMERLCRAVTGGPLMDAGAFWAALQEGNAQNGVSCVPSQTQPVVILPDGTVYSFQRNALTMEGHILYELIAAEITEEYRLYEQLRDNQAKVHEINRRLRGLGAAIEAMTAEKEIMTAKSRIHDELGKALLLARRYLLNPESVDKGELLRVWKRNVMLLKNDAPSAMQDVYIDVIRSAALLGVKVAVEGELPQWSPYKELAALAMTTCLTNTIRHAEGTELLLSCAEDSRAYTLSLQNNGKQPPRPIAEGGGLKTLRQQIEAHNGSMRIEVHPRYTLTITLPKEAAHRDQGLDC